ncbi:MAG TPA: hypothetical protein VEW74_03230 [Candidatus Nitrosotalea sp.]|nr:hypothetical protein [Candidatus Nitrosotalea sp.]
MKRSAALAVLVAALPSSVLAAAAPGPEAVKSFRFGQSDVRFFQDHLMPGSCSIVLERTRCLSDFHAIQGLRGSDPTDDAVAKWLATGDASLNPSNWNGTYVPDRTWAQDATYAWWYTAGVISIAAAMPRNDATAEYLAHYVDELSKHASVTPNGFQSLIASGSTSFEQAVPLQRALDEAIPTAPYPAPVFSTDLLGTMRLGVYNATLLQLVDNPLALSRPESRAFAALVLAELQRRHQQYMDGLSVASLLSAVNAEIPGDPSRLNAEWRQPLAANILNMKWPAASRNAVLLGQLVAQVAYNAAVLKDAASDSGFRKVIGQLAGLPGIPQATATDLLALAQLPAPSDAGSWAAINESATRATMSLFGG